MHRRLMLLTILLIASLLLAACPAPAAPAPAADAPAAAEAESAEPFRIAIVMPSSTTDLAWSQSMYGALLAVQEEMGGPGALEIAYSENMFQVTDAAAAIRDYASEGFDLVMAHGTQYGNSMFDVATDFPETSFAWGTAVDTGTDRGYSNVFAYEAAAQEGGYVNGVIAALLSEAGVIGVVGPVEAGDAKLYIDGFQAGARASRPDVKVLVAYTGSFSDTSQAAETASVQVQAGADVLTGSAQQVAGAINVAREKKLYWVGTQANQASLAPEQVVVCQTYDWTPVLQDILNERRQGRPGGKQYRLTFGNGLVSVFNPQVPVPEKVRASYDKALREQQ